MIKATKTFHTTFGNKMVSVHKLDFVRFWKFFLRFEQETEINDNDGTCCLSSIHA